MLKVQCQCEGHRGRGSQSEQEMWRPFGKKGPARMGTGYIDGGRKNGQKENSATEDPIGKHLQESGRRTIATNSQKIGENLAHSHNTRKSDISGNSSPSDTTLKLSMVPPEGRRHHGIKRV
jgi:hypothetical protein